MKTLSASALRIVLIICLALSAGACSRLGSKGDPRDPFEGLNRSVYTFNEVMDAAIINRLGRFYQAITPEFVDQGITNFFSNINEIIVIINDILQLKIAQAFSDLSRFVLNSTIGLAGLFDVSTSMGFPKHNEDFGQTLAKWGFGSGPYLVVPLLGPSTVRDAAGYVAATTMVSPIAYIDNNSHYFGVMALNYVDFKADLLTADQLIQEAAVDEYEFIKNAYFSLRENLINDREGDIREYEDLDLEAELESIKSESARL